MTAWPLDNTPDYMVVDISSAAQANTQTYYPSADFVPGGVTNSLYKTTTLLMRKIMANGVTWTMGSTTQETQGRKAEREATHQVTLANNYYIGVYEVTQSQWRQVLPNSSAAAHYTTEGVMRPMEQMSYNEVRNAANTATANTAYNWPADPNPSSFLGTLRTKSGLDFDLPSEAQWEFAARAGNGSGYWNDGSTILNTVSDANLNKLGRNLKNDPGNGSSTATLAPNAGGTAIVGSFAPNTWGLYDMHGNVWEWCLDWYEDNISANGGAVNIDRSAPAKTLSGASGSNRVKRGGSFAYDAGLCRSAYRSSNSPSSRDDYGAGIRVVCTAGLQ